MPTESSVGQWPTSAVQSVRPEAASKAKKLSPSVTLLPTNTRPAATAGEPDGGSGPCPMKACHRGTRRAREAATIAVSPAFRPVRAAFCPYIGHSLGTELAGVAELVAGVGVWAAAPQPTAISPRSASPVRARINDHVRMGPPNGAAVVDDHPRPRTGDRRE